MIKKFSTIRILKLIFTGTAIICNQIIKSEKVLQIRELELNLKLNNNSEQIV